MASGPAQPHADQPEDPDAPTEQDEYTRQAESPLEEELGFIESRANRRSVDRRLRLKSIKLRAARSWPIRALPSIIGLAALLIAAVQLHFAASQLRVAVEDSNNTQSVLGQLVALQIEEVDITGKLLSSQSTEPVPGLSATAQAANEVALRSTLSAIQTQQAQLLSQILPTASSTPKGALIDNLNTAELNSSNWLGPICRANGSFQLSYGVLLLSLPANDGTTAHECYIKPANETEIPIQAQAMVELSSSQNQAGFVGISSSCGDRYLALLIAEKAVLVTMEGMDQAALATHDTLPVSYTLGIEWTGQEVRYSIYGEFKHSAACFDFPKYLRFGLITFPGGAASGTIDDLMVIHR